MTLKLLPLLLLLFLHPTALGTHWFPLKSPSPSPLCPQLFVLVNRACSMLPYRTIAPPSPSVLPASDDYEESESSHHSRHHRRHRSRQRHGHGHGHPRHHRHRQTAAAEECCRWLKEVDNVCVCDLLVHLPAFLTRPVHNYTVFVDESCDVTFRCGSRLANL